MSQADQLEQLLSDGQPRRSDEICRLIYHGGQLARVGARVNDLVKRGRVFLNRDGKEITGKGVRRGWIDHNNKTLYWYWMKVEKKPEVRPVMPVSQGQLFSTRVHPY